MSNESTSAACKQSLSELGASACAEWDLRCLALQRSIVRQVFAQLGAALSQDIADAWAVNATECWSTPLSDRMDAVCAQLDRLGLRSVAERLREEEAERQRQLQALNSDINVWAVNYTVTTRSHH